MQQGTNFIIGGEPVHATDVVARQRRIIGVLILLLVIGIPVAFYAGLQLGAAETQTRYIIPGG